MSSRKLGALIVCLGAFTACILILGYGILRPSEPTIPIDTLLSASEQIEIDGRKYVLETYLWRDFMPISPPDGKPLIASILVTATDSLEFPSSIDADRLWVIKGQEVWETEFSDEKRLQEPHRKHQLDKIAREGPKWGSKIQVDVVVRIIDEENNTYLLKASNQWIHRTE